MALEPYEGVVKIEVLDENSNPRSWGTGTLLSGGVLLTAFHVIQTKSGGVVGTKLRVIHHFNPTQEIQIEIKKCKYDVNGDWILIWHKDWPGEVSPRELARKSPRTNDNWRSYGFPASMPNGKNFGGTVEGPDPASRPGVVLVDLRCDAAKDLRDNAAGEGSVPDEASRYSIGGASGAPVFIDGDVAGIVLGHLSNLAFNSLTAVPADQFRRAYGRFDYYRHVIFAACVIGVGCALVLLLQWVKRRAEGECREPFVHLADAERDVWQNPEEVIRLLRVQEGMSVADIGTGSGYFVPFLSCAVGPGGKVYALDTESDMIRRLEKYTSGTNVEPGRVSKNDPGLQAGRVDRVLVVNTWYEINKYNPREYARAIARALRNDGFVLIVDYTDGAREGPPQIERVSPEKVIEDLAADDLFSAVLVSDEALSQQFVVEGRCRDRCGK